MKNLFKLAAALIAASVLAACSGTNAFTPPVAGKSASLVAPSRSANIVTVNPCLPGETSQDGCTPSCASEGNCPTPPPNQVNPPYYGPAPGGYGCISGCSGQPPSGPYPIGRCSTDASCTGPCLAWNNGVCVAHENGPAEANDKCGISTLGIGQDIFGHEGDPKYAINDQFAVSGTLLNGGVAVNIGYIDTTMDGGAFFVPTSVGVSIGVVSVPLNSAIYIGPNQFASAFSNFVDSPAFQSAVKLAQFQTISLGGALVPNLKAPNCYTKPWDGTYPA